MYRPNRIGPHMLVDCNDVQFLADPLVNFASGSMNTNPPSTTSKASENEEFNSENWNFDGNLDVGPNEYGAFGVKILGGQVFESHEYIISYAGSFFGFSADEGMTVRPILGRQTSVGFISSGLEKYAWVPGDNMGHLRTTGADLAPITADANGLVISGDFRPSVDLSEGNWFFGWVIANGSGGAGVVTNVQASMSIHRYLSDLKPFDPNR